MGDGNFGGGGSVRWLINNKVDDSPGGGPRTHRGKDKGPQTEFGAKLFVIFKNAQVHDGPNGAVIVEVTLADDPEQVVLKWGDDIAANPILRSLTQQS
jgi:hypothetical protein